MNGSQYSMQALAGSEKRDALLQEALGAGQAGNYPRSFHLFHDALRLDPDSTNILFNLALVLKQMGRLDEAKQAYARLLEIDPKDADAMYNLANLHRTQGGLAEASHWYAETLRLRPDHVGALNNLGSIRESDNDVESAVQFYQKAVDTDPAFAEGLVNLGAALSRLGRWHEAEKCCRQALAMNSSSAEALNNLAGILRAEGDLAGAEAAYRRAIALRPGFVEAMNNLALTLHADGRLEEEIATLHLCLEARPDYADAHHNLALAYLTGGRLSEGWQEYEWRFHTARKENPLRSFNEPCWDGTPLAGRRILLHAEQGLGDTIQFLRYARLLAQQGAVVSIECQRDLLPLVARAPGVSAVVARGEGLPSFDVHCPLLSVPLRCSTTLENVPSFVPYLFADPALVDQWRSRVHSTGDQLRVGVVWAGNPSHPNDRERSLTPALVNELSIQGVRIFSLQRGETFSLDPQLSAAHRVVDLGPQVTGLSDIAAILEHLDLVISVDTAVGHLAGAMGKPVWMLLSKVPDWRWMLDRADSPWYPTMRLFRQSNRGDWSGVFGSARQALADLVLRKEAATKEAPSGLVDDIAHAADAARSVMRKKAALELVQAGLECAGQAKFNDAEGSFRKALGIDPDCAEALGYLGRIYRDRGDLDQAETLLRKALVVGTDTVTVHENLAELLIAKREYSEARHHLVVAASIDPTDIRISTGLGDLCFAQGKLNDARVFYDRALALVPSSAYLCTRMGNLCRALGLAEEASLWYDQALLLDPEDADAHWNRAQLLLLTEEFKEGWDEYEWRWRHPRFATAVKHFDAPQWNGEPVEGKKILIHAEQGFGDTIQFIRFAPMIAAAGAEVYAGLPPELARLLRSVPGIHDVCLDQASVPQIDFHCPLMSVPRRMHTTSSTIPAEVPYVWADDHVVEKWRHRLGDASEDLRVGIAWAGSRHHENDQHRSCTLDTLAPLLAVDNVSFVSLQKSGGHGDGRFIDNVVLKDFENELTDFAETAGLITCLDLVITTDTAVAHLAGALGKPVWTLLPFAPDWRWGLQHPTSRWYPTMTLYRQSAPSGWGKVVERVVDDLHQVIQMASQRRGRK